MFSNDLARHAGRYYGKYRGEVVDDVDDRHQGTLTVTVPSVTGTETTLRARACVPYGHFFVPPIGAHIWVEFEAGCLELPLWVGTWYPESDVPVEAQIAPPDHRVIQTVAGHTIELVDHEGEERIVIRHSSDASISIDPDGIVLISTSKGADVTLDGDKATVKAAKIVADSSSVALGTGAADPTIMGTAFKNLWMQVMLHTHPSAVGPTGPSPEFAAASLVDGVHLTSAVVVA
jgi:hypothetical protein